MLYFYFLSKNTLKAIYAKTRVQDISRQKNFRELHLRQLAGEGNPFPDTSATPSSMFSGSHFALAPTPWSTFLDTPLLGIVYTFPYLSLFTVVIYCHQV